MNVDAIGLAGNRDVRIDGTQTVGPQAAAEEAEAKAPPGPQFGPAPQTGAEVISSQERLIAAATGTEEVNAQAVEEARALLDSGQLDTPAAAYRAAEAILQLGL